jgi:hypothetical protein
MIWRSPKLCGAMLLALLSGLVACAETPAPRVAAPLWTPEQEARALAAAKRHPIAQPRPRTLYPEQAPPPLRARDLPTQAPPAFDQSLEDAYRAQAGADGTQVRPAPPPDAYGNAPESPPPDSRSSWTPDY